MKAIPVGALLLMACGFAAASSLNVSVTGQFSSSVTASQLASPNGTFSVSFDVAGNPTATNTDLLGFDSSFAGFSYQLNGANVAATPESIRFATASNLGLFTLFFGPESGFDSNGVAIPELSFAGAQIFSGSTTSPTIVPGSYAVASWNYSDAANFDQHSTSSSVVLVVTAVPEPSNLGMTLAVAGLFALILRRRLLPMHLRR